MANNNFFGKNSGNNTMFGPTGPSPPNTTNAPSNNFFAQPQQPQQSTVPQFAPSTTANNLFMNKPAGQTNTTTNNLFGPSPASSNMFNNQANKGTTNNTGATTQNLFNVPGQTQQQNTTTTPANTNTLFSKNIPPTTNQPQLFANPAPTTTAIAAKNPFAAASTTTTTTTTAANMFAPKPQQQTAPSTNIIFSNTGNQNAGPAQSQQGQQPPLAQQNPPPSNTTNISPQPGTNAAITSTAPATTTTTTAQTNNLFGPQATTNTPNIFSQMNKPSENKPNPTQTTTQGQQPSITVTAPSVPPAAAAQTPAQTPPSANSLFANNNTKTASNPNTNPPASNLFANNNPTTTNTASTNPPVSSIFANNNQNASSNPTSQNAPTQAASGQTTAPQQQPLSSGNTNTAAFNLFSGNGASTTTPNQNRPNTSTNPQVPTSSQAPPPPAPDPLGNLTVGEAVLKLRNRFGIALNKINQMMMFSHSAQDNQQDALAMYTQMSEATHKLERNRLTEEKIRRIEARQDTLLNNMKDVTRMLETSGAVDSLHYGRNPRRGGYGYTGHSSAGTSSVRNYPQGISSTESQNEQLRESYSFLKKIQSAIAQSESSPLVSANQTLQELTSVFELLGNVEELIGMMGRELEQMKHQFRGGQQNLYSFPYNY